MASFTNATTSSTSRLKKLNLLLNICFFCLSLFYVVTSYFSEPEAIQTHSLVSLQESIKSSGCFGIHDFTDYQSRCSYVRFNAGCRSKGYIDYLQIFYCTCGRFPLLGYAILLQWLLVLFYLLGNTAANYFCSSLDSLSKLLKLSPTIAGVTLLALGNGAPDVFASIVSFTRSSNGDVGINTVLGGAFFVSSVVVGVINIAVSGQDISVDKSSFIRDASFFLFSLCSLLFLIVLGQTTLLAAIAFLSIYFLYVSVVCFMHFQSRGEKKPSLLTVSSSPPASKSFHEGGQDDFVEMGFPLLGYVDDEKPNVVHNKTTLEDQHQNPMYNYSSFCYCLARLFYIVEMPLYLPRRLTIPVVSEENWSKPYAVISVTLAPLLLAALYNTQGEKKLGSKSNLVTYMIAGLIGVVLGNLAHVTTKKCSPPKKCLFPWLAGGFLMSITWTYIIAEELVSLLISVGYMLGIDPSILGLTVLAWGNSLGDLIANVAMAMNGGSDGSQIAISGCYAGPMFNTIMGLGISLAISAWSNYPSPYVIPEDPSLYETLGFLMGGLLWALFILPRKNMRLGRFLGMGLLAIYLCFLCLRLARFCGLLGLQWGSLSNS